MLTSKRSVTDQLVFTYEFFFQSIMNRFVLRQIPRRIGSIFDSYLADHINQDRVVYRDCFEEELQKRTYIRKVKKGQRDSGSFPCSQLTLLSFDENVPVLLTVELILAKFVSKSSTVSL